MGAIRDLRKILDPYIPLWSTIWALKPQDQIIHEVAKKTILGPPSGSQLNPPTTPESQDSLPWRKSKIYRVISAIPIAGNAAAILYDVVGITWRGVKGMVDRAHERAQNLRDQEKAQKAAELKAATYKECEELEQTLDRSATMEAMKWRKTGMVAQKSSEYTDIGKSYEKLGIESEKQGKTKDQKEEFFTAAMCYARALAPLQEEFNGMLFSFNQTLFSSSERDRPKLNEKKKAYDRAFADLASLYSEGKISPLQYEYLKEQYPAIDAIECKKGEDEVTEEQSTMTLETSYAIEEVGKDVLQTAKDLPLMGSLLLYERLGEKHKTQGDFLKAALCYIQAKKLANDEHRKGKKLKPIEQSQYKELENKINLLTISPSQSDYPKTKYNVYVPVKYEER